MDLIKLESLVFKSEQLANMANALHSAMFESNSRADDYGDAVYLFGQMMDDYRNDMRAFFTEMRSYEKQKNGDVTE